MTDIYMDNKKLKELRIHMSGDDGQWMYLEGITETGEKIDSLYIKGIE